MGLIAPTLHDCRLLSSHEYLFGYRAFAISPFVALSRYGAENGWLGSLAHSVSASGHLRARADQIGAALKTNGPLSERAGGVTG
jgi:hypothetical protein